MSPTANPAHPGLHKNSTTHLLGIGLILCLLAVLPARAVAGYPDYRDTRVNDFANILSQSDENELRTLLDGLKRERGVEAVVVTIRSFRDYGTGAPDFERFATGLFNDWGVGDAARNDGIMLLVAVRDRKVRIELGSGYGRARDAEVSRIIQNKILPRFKSSDYRGGIRQGARAIVDWRRGFTVASGETRTGKTGSKTKTKAAAQSTTATAAAKARSALPAEMPPEGIPVKAQPPASRTQYTPPVRHSSPMPFAVHRRGLFHGFGSLFPFAFFAIFFLSILITVLRAVMGVSGGPRRRSSFHSSSSDSSFDVSSSGSSFSSFDSSSGSSGFSGGSSDGGGSSFGGGDSSGGGSSGSW